MVRLDEYEAKKPDILIGTLTADNPSLASFAEPDCWMLFQLLNTRTDWVWQQHPALWEVSNEYKDMASIIFLSRSLSSVKDSAKRCM